jgi:hypothetical protein
VITRPPDHILARLSCQEFAALCALYGAPVEDERPPLPPEAMEAE